MSVVSQNNVFVIARTNKEGKVEETKFTAEKAMDMAAVGRVLTTTVKGATTFRQAALTFLSVVYSQTNLDGFRAGEANMGDLTTGKVSKEFKAAVRDAESHAVASMVKDGILKLKDNVAIQAFLSGMRDDKNYSNAKVTANRYIAFVAPNVVTPEGYIVPIEVMKEQLAELLPKGAQDNTCYAKLKEFEDRLNATTIDSDDAIDCLAALKRLLPTMEGIVNEYAKQATAAMTASGVDQAADAAIEKAASTLGTRTRVPKEVASA